MKKSLKVVLYLLQAMLWCSGIALQGENSLQQQKLRLKSAVILLCCLLVQDGNSDQAGGQGQILILDIFKSLMGNNKSGFCMGCMGVGEKEDLHDQESLALDFDEGQDADDENENRVAKKKIKARVRGILKQARHNGAAPKPPKTVSFGPNIVVPGEVVVEVVEPDPDGSVKADFRVYSNQTLSSLSQDQRSELQLKLEEFEKDRTARQAKLEAYMAALTSGESGAANGLSAITFPARSAITVTRPNQAVYGTPAIERVDSAPVDLTKVSAAAAAANVSGSVSASPSSSSGEPSPRMSAEPSMTELERRANEHCLDPRVRAKLGGRLVSLTSAIAKAAQELAPYPGAEMDELDRGMLEHVKKRSEDAKKRQALLAAVAAGKPGAFDEL